MRVCYIGYRDSSGLVFPGVDKKIKGQIHAMEKAGFEVSRIDPKFVSKAGRILPFSTSSVNWRSLNLSEYDILYIRYQLADHVFLEFLKRYKRMSPTGRVIVEIPTYPYEDEPKNFIKEYRDNKYRNRMKDFVDEIATFSDDKTIFDIPTLVINNGIDCETVTQRMPSINDNGITMCCIGAFAQWHGADRLLKGINEYTRKGSQTVRKFSVILVGKDGTADECKQYVNRNGLKDYVNFIDAAEGETLDSIYDKCTIAMASLGLHRTNIHLSSSLKSREYFAKGIPFIHSGEIDVLRDHPADFHLEFPENDDSINIDDVIHFHDNLYAKYTEPELIRLIREYAEKYVDWSRTLRPVIDYMQSIMTTKI